MKKSRVNEQSSTIPSDGDEFSTGYRLGERMREAVYINLGLLALKKCIESLNLKSQYVPFQDSKLTMLLSAGLGGDSKTTIVICGSTENTNAGETMAALRFGEKCALIENEARNQASIIAGLLQNLDREISALEAMIKEKERWEMIDEHRKDELAEEGTLEAKQGGVEVKKVTVLVGAEDERKQLEKLLLDRHKLIGCDEEYDQNDEINQFVGKLKYGAIGFGGRYAEKYGLGKKFDVEEDAIENQRFADNVAEESLPSVLRKGGARVGAKKNAVQWNNIVDSEQEQKKRIEKFSKKRSKLVYSGMSF